MRKLICSLIVLLSLIINFNYTSVSCYAEEQKAVNLDEFVVSDEDKADTPSEDVLDKPVFDNEQQPANNVGIKNKLAHWLVKGIIILLIGLAVVICLSFILIANAQRRREKRQAKAQKGSPSVIHAADDFARHRMKK